MVVYNNLLEEKPVVEGVSRKILARGGILMIVEVRFKKGAIGEVHSHPHEQASYIHKGAFEVEIDGKKEILSEGDSMYVPSGTPHGVLALEDSVIIDIFSPQREDFLK